MQVKISQTTPIRPSSLPFNEDHVLPLSHLDTDRNMNVTFRYLRVYVNNDTSAATNKQPYDVIAAALSSALVHYYPLAGTLRRRSTDDRLEVFCSGDLGVPLINANVNCTLESLNYLDDPDYDFVERLVPDPNEVDGLINPCILQITAFECGGYTLGAALHHALCDGLGATQFFNVMAELARGAERVSIQPVWDRTSLLSPRDPPRVEGPLKEFLRLEKGSEPYGQAGKVVRECFNVKDEWLDRFKSLLLVKSDSNFTTFEALGAFLWRAKVKAAGIGGDEVVKFTYAMNIRRVIKPALPFGYWGNGCVPMYAQLLAKDLLEQPIWKTAEVIKKSKMNASDEYVRQFIDFQAVHYADGITAGNRVSGFTDWRHLGHSTVDFGWGGPVTVLPLSRKLLGSVEPCFFLPYSSANAGKNDGFKVLITLEESALRVFEEEMQKFSSQDFELC